jgi:hypothetical protein
MSEMLFCKSCGNPRNLGRRLCDPCNSKRIQKYPRYIWQNTCVACKSSFSSIRKATLLCKECLNLKKKLSIVSTTTYVFTKTGTLLHREIAEKNLKRSLSSDEVVHHLDHNPQNNLSSNLIVLSRKKHSELHQYLNLQKVIWLKKEGENLEGQQLLLESFNWLQKTEATYSKLE